MNLQKSPRLLHFRTNGGRLAPIRGCASRSLRRVLYPISSNPLPVAVAASMSVIDSTFASSSSLMLRSQFPFERLVQNRRQQGVELGGGFGLQALERVHFHLPPRPPAVSTRIENAKLCCLVLYYFAKR